jgi:hypothetical protein
MTRITFRPISPESTKHTLTTDFSMTHITDLSNKFAGPSRFERTEFDYIFLLSITAEVA